MLLGPFSSSSSSWNSLVRKHAAVGPVLEPQLNFLSRELNSAFECGTEFRFRFRSPFSNLEVFFFFFFSTSKCSSLNTQKITKVAIWVCTWVVDTRIGRVRELGLLVLAFIFRIWGPGYGTTTTRWCLSLKWNMVLMWGTLSQMFHGKNATLGIWIIIFCVSRALSDSAAVSWWVFGSSSWAIMASNSVDLCVPVQCTQAGYMMMCTHQSYVYYWHD